MSSIRLAFAALLCVGATVACNKKTEVAADAAGQEAPAQAAPAEDTPEAAEAPAEEAAPVDPNALNTESAEEILASIEGEGTLTAVFVTTKGEIVCELFEKQVPNTVANFVGLATGKKTFEDPNDKQRKTEPFYNGTIFHRVIPGFMIQGGDRLGRGMGGPGYQFADEFNAELRHDGAGVLSMANAGPNTNGSQFFITDAPTPHLDNRHSVFGKCANLDIVTAIANVERNSADRPQEDVKIEELRIERR